VVLHEVPAEHGGLRDEVRVRLNAGEADARCRERRVGKADAIEVGDDLGRQAQDASAIRR
jgi:hypothetical protein